MKPSLAAGPTGGKSVKPPGVGLCFHRVLDAHDVADDKADQQADEGGGGHVGKGTVRKKQDHTHDDHDGGNDSTPEFPICQKILHKLIDDLTIYDCTID